MKLVKDVKSDFIQDYCEDIETTTVEFCSRRERIGFSSEYRIDKWEFTDKEQGGGPWMEKYQEETSRVSGGQFWLNPT